MLNKYCKYFVKLQRIKDKIMSTNGHGNHHQNGRFSSTNDTMVGEFDDVEIDHYDDIIEENSQMYIFSQLLKLPQSLFQNDIFMLASGY